VSVAAPPDAGLGWRAYHLVCHGDRDRLLAQMVRPLAASLLRGGVISRFFFIRYAVGGPHVRFRVLPCPGREREAGERVHAAAAEFFARHPSPASLAPETIRERNRGVAASDPGEAQAVDLVLPGDSVIESPVQLETERYGGPERLADSVALFTLSSIDALSWLDEGEPTAARRLTEASRSLLRHAWSFAADPDEMVRLVGSAAGGAAGPLERFVGEGDAAFDRRPEPLVARVRSEMEALSGIAASTEIPMRWAEGPRLLGATLRATPADVRLRIASSHAHMSANRLGITVAEEVYVSRMLWRAARALADAEPAFWSEAAARLASSVSPEVEMDGLVRISLQRFTGDVIAATA
jgi:hypothetical protein